MVRARFDADGKWAGQTGGTDGVSDADVQFQFDRGIEQYPCGLASTKKAPTGRTFQPCDRRRDRHYLRGFLHERGATPDRPHALMRLELRRDMVRHTFCGRYRRSNNLSRCDDCVSNHSHSFSFSILYMSTKLHPMRRNQQRQKCLRG